MTLGALGFISLAHIKRPSMHRAYNEWHQLDHRPENLALPEVAWGERWVRAPDCEQIGDYPSASLGSFHYLNHYWLRHPAESSRRTWSELAERSLHWGRRADLDLCTRPYMGFFVPVKGYVAPRVLVSADALPIRPNRGVYVELFRFPNARSGALRRYAEWFDQVRAPQMLAYPGVAGVWTFASDGSFGAPMDLVDSVMPESIRLNIAYLDEDPVAILGNLREQDSVEYSVTEVSCLFSGVLRSIAPWEWDWFEPYEGIGETSERVE